MALILCLCVLVPSDAPRNLRALVVAENSISIQWDEIECLDQNGIITRYDISLDGSPLASTDARQFMLTGLSPSTNYTITVSGVNGAGSGPPSSIVTETAKRPPSSPSLLLGEQGITTLSLSWVHTPDDEVDSYKLRWTYLGNCSGFAESMSVFVDESVRQFVFRGLQEFSSYQVGVTAVNSAGQSAESVQVADTRSAREIHDI